MLWGAPLGFALGYCFSVACSQVAIMAASEEEIEQHHIFDRFLCPRNRTIGLWLEQWWNDTFALELAWSGWVSIWSRGACERNALRVVQDTSTGQFLVLSREHTPEPPALRRGGGGGSFEA